jgi:hypothetical protein
MKTDATKPAADIALVVLGCIRILNGGLALIAPKVLLRRLGADPAANPAAVYVFRMFGIRTILIGVDLLRSDPTVREPAARAALLIHGSDLASAVIAGFRGDLPRQAALKAAAISGANVMLSVLLRRRTATAP